MTCVVWPTTQDISLTAPLYLRRQQRGLREGVGTDPGVPAGIPEGLAKWVPPAPTCPRDFELFLTYHMKNATEREERGSILQ